MARWVDIDEFVARLETAMTMAGYPDYDDIINVINKTADRTPTREIDGHETKVTDEEREAFTRRISNLNQENITLRDQRDEYMSELSEKNCEVNMVYKVSTEILKSIIEMMVN